MNQIPFQTIDWTIIEPVEYKGESGIAVWQTVLFPELRIRMVEYSKGYTADHWCEKGHIVHCLEGAFTSRLQSGEVFAMLAGMSYVVTDNAGSHLSITETGAKLLIIDGDFLNVKTQ